MDTRLNWNAKEFVSTEEHNTAEKPLKKPTNQRKVQCKGARCSNQPKRGCDFDMCGRCCKKVAEPCSVHEDAFSVFEPPVFERNYSFFKIEPKAFFRFAQKLFTYIVYRPCRLKDHLGWEKRSDSCTASVTEALISRRNLKHTFKKLSDCQMQLFSCSPIECSSTPPPAS